MTRWKLGILISAFLGVLAMPARSESPSSAPAASAPASSPSFEDPAGRPTIAGRRIVKHFDFNEQPFGNYESLPMFWRRHGGTGFPLFLEGQFDAAVGHSAAPSFRFDLNGGSLAYHYEGRDISVRTSSDYLVVAWVKTQGLETARAYMSAYYLDRKGNEIPSTEQQSSLAGGHGATGDWAPITVSLPGNVPVSRYIGISLWVTQASVWDTRPRSLRSIEREDTGGRAWFDDITVYRLPRVTLRSASAGNIFGDDEPVELLTEVNDPDGLNLNARLVVRSADGKKVDERPVAIHSGQSPASEPFHYDKLPVGLYEAELVVATGETVLVHRSVHFVRVAGLVSPPQAGGRGFGLVMRDVAPRAYAGQKDLLKHLRVEYVKLPVWSPQRALLEADSSNEEMVRYLESIVAAGADPIGILRDEQDIQHRTRSMLDLLTDDPAGWKSLIAGVWSRYAGLIHVWQVGTDGDESIQTNPRLPDVLNILRREMKPLMSRPLLACSSSLHDWTNAESAGDYRSVVLPAQVPPDAIAEQLASRLNGRTQHSWVLVQALPSEQYPRDLRLADLCRRLAEAYFSGVEGVFFDAPWSIPAEGQTHPHEDLIVFRTVADVLGGSKPVTRIVIDGQANGMVFDRHGQATILVWDGQAPPEGREHILYLGENAQEVDIWGHRRPLKSIGGEQVMRVGPVPKFIINTPTWITQFRHEFVLEPSRVEASFDVYTRTVVFRNTNPQPINGNLHLVAPEGWDIRPNRVPVTLLPGETFRQPIEVRFPLNAESGVIPLVGEFEIDADRRYRILATAWFDFGLTGIEMETYTYRAGDRLIVRQSMTNRTHSPVSFDGYLIVPGRQRIARSFYNFETGQTVTKDFILDGVAELAGQKIRIGLKEVQGTRVWNRLVDVPD